MEWKVAPSYENMTFVSIDEEARRAKMSKPCWKCGGSGYYMPFGECFACGGTGKNYHTVKIYTPEEYEKYMRNAERTRERKAEKREAERRFAEEHSEENLKKALAEAGYDPEDPQVYVIGGANTFAIKDWLKENGFKFNSELNWYCMQPKEVPAPYKLAPIPFSSCFEWNCYFKKFNLKEGVKELADAARNSLYPKSNSEWMGDIKERLRNIEVTYVSSRDIESYYGLSILYTFKAGENILVWFCSGKGLPQDIEVGDSFLLTGTVKDHKEYNGVKQTVLTRCSVK